MKKGTAVTFAVGVFAGLALCGPAAQAASGITATLSDQPIYVDGQRVSMTAYQIGGNNYVKLRDVGSLVGFNVYWDGEAVQIESDKPYTGEGPVTQTPTPAPTPAPASITEESVQATLAALREQYPNGALWPSPCRSASGGPYGASSHSCAGWATLCSDTAFGDLPWRRVDRPSWEQIRAGDLVEYRNGTTHHVVVVLDRTDEYISTTESGTNNKARWGGQYPQWWLEDQPTYILYTRYPQ